MGGMNISKLHNILDASIVVLIAHTLVLFDYLGATYCIYLVFTNYIKQIQVACTHNLEFQILSLFQGQFFF